MPLAGPGDVGRRVEMRPPGGGDFQILKMSFRPCSKNLAENRSSNLDRWPSLIRLGAGAPPPPMGPSRPRAGDGASADARFVASALKMLLVESRSNSLNRLALGVGARSSRCSG